jgi:hypothetical protein
MTFGPDLRRTREAHHSTKQSVTTAERNLYEHAMCQRAVRRNQMNVRERARGSVSTDETALWTS